MANRLAIELSTRAKSDLREATAYYFEVSTKIGDKFLTQFEVAIQSILLSPHYAIKYDDVRTKTLRHFPYAIHYRVEQQLIRILGVLHTAQNPDHWFFVD